MHKAYEKIKKAFEENPLQVIFVAGIAMQGAAKLMKANTERQNAKTYRMEVQRRLLMNKR